MLQKRLIFFCLAFLVSCLILALSSCTICPKPLSIDERLQEAHRDLRKLSCQQEPLPRQIDFYEALARGIKYNLDYRIKLVNTALQAGQLQLAAFTMFPALNASYSIYSRNNLYASTGITPQGTLTDVLNSTPNTIRSARMGLSWNILDFGLGYVKAKQQGHRIYIAEEESKKQMQQLSQDILVAYWNAYSAQQLMIQARSFQTLLTQARNKLKRAMLDPAIPKENILNFEAALLEGNRRIIQLEYKYEKAMLDLKRLINLPDAQVCQLKAPPLAFARAHDLSCLDFRKLDAIALVSRPELRGQHYQERIAELGVSAAILQALPGITLNFGPNYNSNQFLVNQKWADKSLDIAWNLLNLASLPTSYCTAETQVKYENLKLMALTVTVLTEVRYAYFHYETLRREYDVAHQQTENANAIFRLNRDRHLASLASEQQVIIARLRTLTAKMDENLLLADLSTALGEMYLSIGTNYIPCNIGERPLREAIHILHCSYENGNIWDFNHYVNLTYDKLFPCFHRVCVPHPMPIPVVKNFPKVCKKVLKSKRRVCVKKEIKKQLCCKKPLKIHCCHNAHHIKHKKKVFALHKKRTVLARRSKNAIQC